MTNKEYKVHYVMSTCNIPDNPWYKGNTDADMDKGKIVLRDC